MKTIILTALLVMLLAGCSNSTMRTPPWTENEIQMMEDEDIHTVPLIIWRAK